jgi:hypothetical protein
MFDGTDLSVAFGGNAYDQYQPMQSQQVQSVQMKQSPPPPPPQPEMPQPPPPPELPYNPPSAMFLQQQNTMLPPPQETFFDRAAQKKTDVLKLFILSLVVLMGISMDKLITHYLTTYIGKAFLTETQEFLIRLSYPVLILLSIWIIKTLA